jgi:hypothetical protein
MIGHAATVDRAARWRVRNGAPRIAVDSQGCIRRSLLAISRIGERQVGGPVGTTLPAGSNFAFLELTRYRPSKRIRSMQAFRRES